MARDSLSSALDSAVAENSDMAREAAQRLQTPAPSSSPGRLGLLSSALVSALAILFSGVSLYHSVLKQAQISMHAPDAISYTRDPNGSYEVFIIPVTLTNAGARDGLIVALQAHIKNLDANVSRTLYASYLVQGDYFSTRPDVTKHKFRPKIPFAPLSVAGHSAFSGSLLFYPRKYSAKKLIMDKGRFEITLSARVQKAPETGLFALFGADEVKPVRFQVELSKVSRYFEGQMLSGDTIRLYRRMTQN